MDDDTFKRGGIYKRQFSYRVDENILKMEVCKNNNVSTLQRGGIYERQFSYRVHENILKMELCKNNIAISLTDIPSNTNPK